jgi:hypothetical protein
MALIQRVLQESNYVRFVAIATPNIVVYGLFQPDKM